MNGAAIFMIILGSIVMLIGLGCIASLIWEAYRKERE